MRLAQQMGGRVGGGAVTPLTNGSCVPSYRSQSTSTVVLFPLLPCTAIISSHVIYWVKSPQRSRSPRLCMHRRPWPPWPSAALHSASISTGEKKAGSDKSTQIDRHRCSSDGMQKESWTSQSSARTQKAGWTGQHTHTQSDNDTEKHTHTHTHLWVQFINKTFHVIKGSFLDFFFLVSLQSLCDRVDVDFFCPDCWWSHRPCHHSRVIKSAHSSVAVT